jgi:hydroxymethylpyrimidine kinase/phosphomethylpyrimidine kinase
VAAQIETVATDIGLDAVKTGMLASTAVIEAVVGACDRVGIGADGTTPLVLDPVAASMHGDQLLADSALDAFRDLLFPRATIVTPNLDEVRLLVGIDVHDRAAQYEAAKALHALGARSGAGQGRAPGEDTDVCVDLLYDGTDFTELPGRASTPATPTAAATAWPRRSPRRWPAGWAWRRRWRSRSGTWWKRCGLLPARRRARPGVATVGRAPWWG